MKKFSIGLIGLIALGAVSIGTADAQNKHKPNNFMNEQLSEQLHNQTVALSDSKLIKAQAELLRKHYEALIDSGFSKDESLKIIIAMASRDRG
jgi:hypothetical protein